MNDIIKTIKSLDDSNALIGCISETINHEIKKQENIFFPDLLATLAVSLLQPVISSVREDIGGRGVKRVGRVYIDKNV